MGQWVDYDVTVHNVFSASTGSAWVEYRYSIGYVGWRQLQGNDGDLARMTTIASAAKQFGWRLRFRVTNDGKITGMQTR